MSDGKDAADFVAENRNDREAIAAERARRFAALKAAESFGHRILARARLEAFDRALVEAGIFSTDAGK